MQSTARREPEEGVARGDVELTVDARKITRVHSPSPVDSIGCLSLFLSRSGAVSPLLIELFFTKATGRIAPRRESQKRAV